MLTAHIPQRMTSYTSLHGLIDEVDHTHENKIMLRHVKRIMSRWLPACQEFALWVNDMPKLTALVEQLNRSYSRLIGYLEASEYLPEDLITCEIQTRVTKLHTSAIEFDRFLQYQATDL